MCAKVRFGEPFKKRWFLGLMLENEYITQYAYKHDFMR
jgi:hypothetical protein